MRVGIVTILILQMRKEENRQFAEYLVANKGAEA